MKRIAQGKGAVGMRSWGAQGWLARGAAGVAVATVLVGLAACSATDDSPVGSPTPMEASTPSVEIAPSRTPMPEVVETPALTPEAPIDRSDPEDEIYFEDLPDVTGDLREALDAYTLFELESTRSTINGVVSPILADLADPQLIQRAQHAVDVNIAGEWTIEGPATIRILDIGGAAMNATVDSCIDSSQMRFTSPEESVIAEELGVEAAYARTDLAQDEPGRWRVVDQHRMNDMKC